MLPGLRIEAVMKLWPVVTSLKSSKFEQRWFPTRVPSGLRVRSKLVRGRVEITGSIPAKLKEKRVQACLLTVFDTKIQCLAKLFWPFQLSQILSHYNHKFSFILVGCIVKKTNIKLSIIISWTINYTLLWNCSVNKIKKHFCCSYSCNSVVVCLYQAFFKH